VSNSQDPGYHYSGIINADGITTQVSGTVDQTFESFPALVAQELVRARSKFPVPESTPPGWTKHQLMHYWLAVIEEEFEELKLDVFEQHLSANVMHELIQLAAMCQRAAESCGFVERCK